MSKVDLNREQRAGAIRIPRDNYKLRITEEPEFKMSKEKPGKPQYPMLVFKAEIVEPATMVIDGEETTLAGEEFGIWAVFFQDRDNPEIERSPTLSAIHSQTGLPLSFARSEESGLPVDDNGVPISYVGLEFWAKCSSKEYTEKSDSGEVLKNPLTGEALKGWQRNVDRIYSAAAQS